MTQTVTLTARTAEATALTELILETFRLNGCLLAGLVWTATGHGAVNDRNRQKDNTAGAN